MSRDKFGLQSGFLNREMKELKRSLPLTYVGIKMRGYIREGLEAG